MRNLRVSFLIGDKMTSLREKLNSKNILIGTQLFTGSKEIAELYGSMQYDFVFICAEHPAYGIETVRDLVKYTEGSGTPALVRLPELDLTFTKKVLDLGASGVLFSMIKDKKDASLAMDMCLYPPYGKRGFGPMAAVKWGLESERDFVYKNNAEGTVRMLQIEHVGMVDDLEEIAKNPYIDCFIFGPNDLAASMGRIMNIYHPEVQSVIRRATEILSRRNKRFGVSLGAIDAEKFKFWKELGMTVFSVGSDFAYARDGALNVLERLNMLR